MSSGPTFDVIVVAAGSGLRMGGVDKSLIPIAGKPALRWSLESFAATAGVQRIVIVTAQDRVATYAALPWIPASVVAVVPGGETRSASVGAGLKALERAPGEVSDVLLIHDAARPGIDPEVTLRVVTAAHQHRKAGAALVAGVVRGNRWSSAHRYRHCTRSRCHVCRTPMDSRLRCCRCAWWRDPIGFGWRWPQST